MRELQKKLMSVSRREQKERIAKIGREELEEEEVNLIDTIVAGVIAVIVIACLVYEITKPIQN